MQRRHTIIGLIAVILAIVLPLVAYYWIVIVDIPRTMSDFAALWNSTDALTHYVKTKSEWPSDWDELSLAFADLSFDRKLAEELVEVNFEVELGSPLREDEWFVRLKSGGMQPEQESANQRLRKFISWHQDNSTREPESDDSRQQ